MNLKYLLTPIILVPALLFAQEAEFGKQKERTIDHHQPNAESEDVIVVSTLIAKSPQFAAINQSLAAASEAISNQSLLCEDLRKNATSTGETDACWEKLRTIQVRRDSLQAVAVRLEQAVRLISSRFEKTSHEGPRLSKAFREFRNGDLRAANNALDAKQIQLEGEQLLLQKSSRPQRNLDSLLEIKANELIAKAFIKAADFGDPASMDSILFSAHQALRFHESANNRISLGVLFYQLGYLKEAINVTEKALSFDLSNYEEIILEQNLFFFYKEDRQPGMAEKAMLKALVLMEKLSKADSQMYQREIGEDYYSLGRFYIAENRLQDAEKSFLQAKTFLAQPNGGTPQQKYDLSVIFMELGSLYLTMAKMSSAEAAYVEAMTIRDQLAKIDSETYSPSLGRTLNELGKLYFTNYRNEEAEKLLTRAFTIFERLAKMDSESFEGDFSTSQQYLCTQFIQVGKLKEAERFCRRAMDLYGTLVKDGRPANESGLACCILNMGTIYWNMQKLNDADVKYEEALSIFERLDATYPNEFDAEMADALLKRARLCSAMDKIEEADKYFGRAIARYERLASSNTRYYSLKLAISLMYQGMLYRWSDRSKEAEANLTRSVQINEDLLKAEPQSSEEDLAMTLAQLAYCKTRLEKTVEAEKLLEHSLAIYERLAKSHPGEFEPSLATIALDLGSAYARTGKLKAAEMQFKRAIEIRSRLAKSDPVTNEPQLGLAYNDYGVFLKHHSRFEEAHSQFTIALNSFQKLILAGNANQFDNFGYPYRNLRDLRDSFALKHAWPTVVALQMERLAAVKALKNLIPRSDSLIADALGSASWYFLFEGKYDEAKRLASEALELDGTQNWIRTNFGHAFLFVGDWETAIQTYREYIEKAEDKALAFSTLRDDWNMLESEKVVSPNNLAAIVRARNWLNGQAK